ncbi:uncharacterized protein LOC144481760 [Mustelus asterias]
MAVNLELDVREAVLLSGISRGRSLSVWEEALEQHQELAWPGNLRRDSEGGGSEAGGFSEAAGPGGDNVRGEFPRQQGLEGVGACCCSRRKDFSSTAEVQRHEVTHTDRTCGRRPSRLWLLRKANKRSGRGSAKAAVSAFPSDTEQGSRTQAQHRRTLNHLSASFMSPECSNEVSRQPRQPVHGVQRHGCMCSSQNSQPLSHLQDKEPAPVKKKPRGCAECNQPLSLAKELYHRSRIKPYTQRVPSDRLRQEMRSASERHPSSACRSPRGLERGSRGHSPERRPFTPGKALNQAHSLQTYKCSLPKGDGDQGADGGLDGVTDRLAFGGPGRVRGQGADGGLDGMTDQGAGGGLDGVTDRLAFGGPGRVRGLGADGGLDGMTDQGAGGGLDGVTDRLAFGGPGRVRGQGADGGLDGVTDQGSDGGLEWETDQRSGRGLKRGTDRGSDGEADGGVVHSQNCPECVVVFDEQQLTCQRGERLFECADCGKAFTRLRGLQDHQRIHTGERPFICIDCGKTFTRMSALRVHLQVHGGDRPYQCSLCGMKFAFGSRLRRHMRTHTGERPYICSECGVAFAQSSNLKDHQRSHSGEKPHVCRECGRAFVSSSTLVKHLRTHTGEKPYRCDLCSKSFTQSSTLKRHKCPVAQGQAGAGRSGQIRAADGVAEEILCICECGKPYVKRDCGEPHHCPHTTQRDYKGKHVL